VVAENKASPRGSKPRYTCIANLRRRTFSTTRLLSALVQFRKTGSPLFSVDSPKRPEILANVLKSPATSRLIDANPVSCLLIPNPELKTLNFQSIFPTMPGTAWMNSLSFSGFFPPASAKRGSW
jgi:hypothetical protein